LVILDLLPEFCMELTAMIDGEKFSFNPADRGWGTSSPSCESIAGYPAAKSRLQHNGFALLFGRARKFLPTPAGQNAAASR